MPTNDAVTAVPEKFLVEANKVVEFVRAMTEILPVTPTKRSRVAVSCFVIAQGHHEAIVLLSEHEMFATSFSLVRVAFDAYVRGLWLSLCATDAEVEKFIAYGEPPSTERLVSAIDALPDYEEGFLSAYKKQNYKRLCDFTHTGGRQTQRWNRADVIEPNYPLEEVLEVMATSQSISLLTLLGIIGLVEDKEIAQTAIEQFRNLQAQGLI